jgi:hypothetical protein
VHEAPAPRGRPRLRPRLRPLAHARLGLGVRLAAPALQPVLLHRRSPFQAARAQRSLQLCTVPPGRGLRRDLRRVAEPQHLLEDALCGMAGHAQAALRGPHHARAEGAPRPPPQGAQAGGGAAPALHAEALLRPQVPALQPGRPDLLRPPPQDHLPGHARQGATASGVRVRAGAQAAHRGLAHGLDGRDAPARGAGAVRPGPPVRQAPPGGAGGRDGEPDPLHVVRVHHRQPRAHAQLQLEK